MKTALGTIFLTGGLALTSLLAGCGPGTYGVGYRSYDPYDSTYYVWGPNDNTYYNTWLHENHRHYTEFRHLSRSDQHEYWTWRHDRYGEHGNHYDRHHHH